MEESTLVVYYSSVFPKYLTRREAFERKSVELGQSFTTRAEIWLAVHSLLRYQDEQLAAASRASQSASVQEPASSPDDAEAEEINEREERCRVAIMSSMFAARKVLLDAPQTIGAEDI